MVKLLRHFSLASAAAVLSVAVVLVMLYRHNAVHRLVETAESQDVALARGFANTLWPRLSTYVTDPPGLDGDALRQIPAVRALDESKTPPTLHTRSPYRQADPRGGHA